MDAADLAEYIHTQQIEAELLFLSQPTPTVAAAAQAAGVASDQIVKSVLFMIRDSANERHPRLVIGNGERHVDQAKLARFLGLSPKRVRLASPEQVERFTGYAVGAVPPFGHPRRLPTIIERQVLAQEEVLAGGGAASTLVRLSTAELQRVLQAEIADLAR